MDPLDLWVEYMYTAIEADKYLIDTDCSDTCLLRPVKYTVNVDDWNFYKYPKIQVYSFLYDLYNIMVF